MKTPLIVAVEGIDGAGKSTQIPRISEWFRRHGCVTNVSCEPTHGPIGMQIRTAQTRLAPDVERRLFVEDRQEHLRDCILPALERHEIVITDRYFYSSIAYQGTRRDAFLGENPTEEELIALQEEIYAENRAFAPEADILIYLRLDADTALARMKASREGLDPFENRQNLIRVSEAFSRIVKRHAGAIVVDANLPADAVTRELEKGLERWL